MLLIATGQFNWERVDVISRNNKENLALIVKTVSATRKSKSWKLKKNIKDLGCNDVCCVQSVHIMKVLSERFLKRFEIFLATLSQDLCQHWESF